MENYISSLPITIIRTAESLSLLANVQASKFENPIDNKEVSSWDDLYSNQLITAEDNDEYQKIKEHFDALKGVNDYDALLLARVILLLYKTTPSYDGGYTLPDITDVLFDAPKPSATPRHTRGFKGTKDRRPTGKSAGVLDIREVLMDNKNLDRLLEKLWPYRNDALKTLEEWGYKIDGLPVLIKAECPPILFQMKLKHKNIPANEKVLISKAFNEEIMPVFSNESWDFVRKAIRIYYVLDLENNKQLRSIICRLLDLSDDKDKTLLWLNDITHISIDKLIPTLVFIIETKLYEQEFNAEKLLLINTLAEDISSEFYSAWAYTIIESLERGYSAKCMSQYAELSLEFYGAEDFIKHYSLNNKSIMCGGCDASIISSTISALSDDYSGRGDVALNLWGNCGYLDGLIDILKQSLSLGLPEKHFSLYTEFFIYPSHWHDFEYDIDEKWESFKNTLPKIQKHMKDVKPEYIDKWFDIFTDCIGLYKDTADSTFETSLSIASKLSREPFLKESECANAISKFLDISDEVTMELFLSIPDDNFMVLDKACKRKNDGSLIAWGLSVIAELEPKFTFESFQKSPKKLIKVMKLIGPMSWENRNKVINDFQKHPAFTANYDDLIKQPNKLIKFIDDQDIVKEYNPVPKAFREYVNGSRKLSDEQVKRHLTKLKENIIVFKLQALEECGSKFLQSDFNTSINENNIRHALKLYHSLDRHESKKAFKRFLDNYLKDGSTTYRDGHYLSLQWIKKHPNVNYDLWVQGLTDFKNDEIKLSIECEPLEALKMGTYVGSCLGLGGIWTESAVAILLDINKQVLYARNAKGSVIARQVLAISDEDQLVAFEVYPLSISKKIKRMFAEYNQKFSTALKLPLFQDNDDDDADYKISLILAKNWWDDGAWGSGHKKISAK